MFLITSRKKLIIRCVKFSISLVFASRNQRSRETGHIFGLRTVCNWSSVLRRRWKRPPWCTGIPWVGIQTNQSFFRKLIARAIGSKALDSGGVDDADDCPLSPIVHDCSFIGLTWFFSVRITSVVVKHLTLKAPRPNAPPMGETFISNRVFRCCISAWSAHISDLAGEYWLRLTWELIMSYNGA